MITEKIELTMSHIGLGTLNEYALMVLFGNAHSHHLTFGTGITPDQIKDSNGSILYPAYFMTHVKVPPNALLNTYKLWEKIKIKADVKRFGKTILDSRYILSRGDEIPDDVENWDINSFPFMKGNNLMVVEYDGEETTNRSISTPIPECMADLERISKPPAAIRRANQIRMNGFDLNEIKINLKNKKPVIYQVLKGRDAAEGHAMIFAKFPEVMDYAEHKFLGEELKPGFQKNILQNMALLEREVFYYGNCFSGEILEIYLRGNMVECPNDFHGESTNIISSAIFTFFIDIYQQKTNLLLASAKVKKLAAIPSNMQNAVYDVKRLMSIYKE